MPQSPKPQDRLADWGPEKTQCYNSSLKTTGLENQGGANLAAPVLKPSLAEFPLAQERPACCPIQAFN